MEENFHIQNKETLSKDALRNTIQNLLSKGVSEFTSDIDIVSLQKLMHYLSFESVVLPHKKLIVLKDLAHDEDISYPWTEKNISQAHSIFVKLAHGGIIKKDMPAADLLISKNWLNIGSDGEVELSERALVQFSDVILAANNGLYKKCQICGFLCKNKNLHSECEAILSKS